MSLIAQTELRINDQPYGIDGGSHHLNIKVDPPTGEPGKYSYMADVEKIENGLHVHWKKVSSSIDQDSLSNMTAAANKTARWVGAIGLLFIVFGATTLFIKLPVKDRSRGIVRIATAVTYILAGLAMVVYARNRWVA